MNNDRGLLELAAKAAGIEGEFGDKFNIGPDEVDCTDLFFIEDDSNCAVWNPLTDDGDAMRLAVMLNFHIELHDELVRVWYTDRECVELYFNPEDKLDATRRAIVRAAAEIGKDK